MSILVLILELWQIYKKSLNWKYPHLNLIQYLETGEVKDTTRGMNVPPEKLLNTRKRQIFLFMSYLSKTSWAYP